MPRERVRTAIALVRHGESTANAERRFGGHGPAPLTELGRQQARRAGQLLAETFSPTAIVSSDSVRAIQTAQQIAAITRVQHLMTPDLRERGLGQLDGALFDQIQHLQPDDWESLLSPDPDVHPGGGESQREVHARVARCLDEIVLRNAGGRVIVVSHAFALHFVFLHVCGIAPFEAGRKLWVRLGNCSVSRLTHADDGVWQLESLNEQHHLSGLQKSEP